MNYLYRIPQYIREKPKFNKFICGLCDYIQDFIDKCLLHNTINISEVIDNTNFSEELVLHILNCYLDRLNIFISYITNLDNLSNYDTILTYKEALLGSTVLRNTDSTYENIKKLFSIALSVPKSSVTITSDNNDSMVVVISIKKGYEKRFKYLGDYINPNISGVTATIELEGDIVQWSDVVKAQPANENSPDWNEVESSEKFWCEVLQDDSINPNWQEIDVENTWKYEYI